MRLRRRRDRLDLIVAVIIGLLVDGLPHVRAPAMMPLAVNEVAATLLRGGLGAMRLGYGGGDRRRGAARRWPSPACRLPGVRGVLKNVQAAWSKGDLAELRQYVTPEMLSVLRREAGRETRARASKTASSRSSSYVATCARRGTRAGCNMRPARCAGARSTTRSPRPPPGRSRLHRLGRPAAADRGGRDLDLRAQPGRALAAVGDPAGLRADSANDA